MTRGFDIVSYDEFKKTLGKGLNDEVIKEKYNDMKKPRRATSSSAGYDFYCVNDFTLSPGESIVVPTGIKSYMKEDECLYILVRSSHGFKYNIRLKNQVGLIDSDYYNNEKNEGHIFVALKNEGDKNFEVKCGEAFAQGIFQKYLIADDDEPVQINRVGGIGSTSK